MTVVMTHSRNHIIDLNFLISEYSLANGMSRFHVAKNYILLFTDLEPTTTRDFVPGYQCPQL